VSAERASQASTYFAENAEHWDEIRSLHTAEAAVEAAILDAAGEGPFERLVDLGTGSGRMLTLLGARARRAVGLDLSRQMLNMARSHVASAGLADCELRHGDILRTGLPGGQADLVIVHPGAAVAEAARLAAPGGKVLIVDFAPHDLEFLRAEHRHRRLGFLDEEMARWLGESGLEPAGVASLQPEAQGGLTVKIWSGRREGAQQGDHLRVVA
jgi:ArsR family transcriptional regulator